MKAKFGFVSNSSTTNFIVASKKTHCKVKIDLDLSELGVTVNTIEELNNIVQGEGGWEYMDKNKYDRCLRALEDGKVLHFVTVSNESDNAIETLIYNHGITDFLEKDADVL